MNFIGIKRIYNPDMILQGMNSAICLDNEIMPEGWTSYTDS